MRTAAQRSTRGSHTAPPPPPPLRDATKQEQEGRNFGLHLLAACGSTMHQSLTITPYANDNARRNVTHKHTQTHSQNDCADVPVNIACHRLLCTCQEDIYPRNPWQGDDHNRTVAKKRRGGICTSRVGDNQTGASVQLNQEKAKSSLCAHEQVRYATERANPSLSLETPASQNLLYSSLHHELHDPPPSSLPLFYSSLHPPLTMFEHRHCTETLWRS